MFVSVLTGRRPTLLTRTLQAIEEHAPNLTYHIVHNGADPETIPVYLASSLSIKVEAWPEWVGIGEATSRCAGFARESGDEFWVHIEDDFLLERPLRLAKSMMLLRERSDIGQVRLRSTADRVMRTHHITHRPIVWQRSPDFWVGNAHATFNPAVWRTRDLDVFPVTGEGDIMRRFPYRLNAQSDPGYFTHIGAGHSLR